MAEARPALLLLLASSVLVLLVACANVANLFLARGEGRRREMSVRRALGAAGGRITRQLLTEGLLLATVGGVLGVMLAWWGVDVLLALDRGGVPRVEEIGLDLQVLAFAAGLVVLTTVAFALAPAIQSAAADATAAVRNGGRAFTGSERMLARRGLTIVEVALAVTPAARCRTRFSARALDPKLPIARLQTMDDLVAGRLARPRFLVTLVGLFAGIALLLGGIGVYGVMSHGVTRRTHEIGIRMALGAARADVARAVLGEGL